MQIFKFMAIALLVGMTTAATAAENSGARGVNAVGINLGSNSGGVTFGGNFEHMIENSLSVDGHMRFFSKDSSHGVSGLTIIGAGLNHHFYKKTWDLDFAPGLNIIKYDANSGSNDTVFGPDLSLSILNQCTPSFAWGFDFTQFWVWFNTDHQGSLISDMSLKARFSF